MKEVAERRTHPLIPMLATGLGVVLFVWGLILVLSGQQVAQGWSLIGVGAATFGSAGFTWRRRR